MAATSSGALMASERKQYLGIDLLRFAAAAIVTVYHLTFWVTYFPTGMSAKVAITPIPATLISPHMEFGWIGVQIFFVISGFVIAFSAAQASASQFLKSRLLRLAPAVWILAPLSAVALVTTHALSTKATVAILLKSLAFFPFSPWVDSVYWTLGIEISFYAMVFVLLIAGLMRFFEHVMSAVGLISLVYWIASLWLNEPHNRLFELALIEHGCFFALGAFLWLVSARGVTNWRLVMIGLSIAAAMIEIPFEVHERALKTGSPGHILPPIIVWGSLVAFMVASILLPAVNKSLAPWSVALRKLGLMTYPLYLGHNVLGAALLGGLARLGFTGLLPLVGVAALSAGLAYIVAVILEPRLRTWLSRTFDAATDLVAVLVARRGAAQH
ncbi:acyltransferase family protein [Caulobacter hibisci]|uniref:Acyltransferase n=1 Tax=Caulobacter hibisci TaxID=2035993 RepID=A0ABS0SXS8_9CAUL|nr:acyltransferase [Caulobacter hibisci]MBI1684452.1 acyltransferase [Caulobacter hibisci]